MTVEQRSWSTRAELRWALLTLGLLGVGLAPPVYAEVEAAWQKVRTREGITSFRRERPGAALAGFRSRTSIEANLWSVLAVLEDVNRAREWTAHCAEMRQLSGVSERDMLVYARTDAPWPVRDRDVVTRVITTVLSPNDVLTEIRSVDHLPEKDGLVRIPSLIASYAFHAKSEERVEVEYTIEVDPGGTLPDWLKNMIGRDLAHDTLQRLRERTRWAQERGAYSARALHLREMANTALAARRGYQSNVALTHVAQ